MEWKDLEFKQQMADNLKVLKDNGVQVVRWQLLGNGLTYGLPPRVIKAQTTDVNNRAVMDVNFFGRMQLLPRYGKNDIVSPLINLSNPLTAFDPPATLDPLFLDHFRQLLEMHKAVNMQLIPSLISFEFFETHDTAITNAGGRGSVAEDATKRNKFLFSVLGEFLRVSLDYKKLIYAWEVINEPIWTVIPVPINIKKPFHLFPYVQPSALVAFISLALNWIEDKKFPSTVGHRFQSDLSILPTGTQRQFHYYSEKFGPFGDYTPLPSASTANAHILGEFGSVIGKGYEKDENIKGEALPKGSYGHPWDQDFPDHRDRDPARTVFERLRLIRSLGYQLALVWPDLDDNSLPGDTLKLSPLKLSQIKAFAADSY
ncbi:MAG: hypothetical protein P0111_13865 [Nitrospira sp.]|nr:hypothetical protein [Nitrospira sp.]